jgi:hypothetical protein
MGISGSLSTMPLPDVLQWASGGRKTGVLELERHGRTKGILFESGNIVACSTNDPPARLGQVLLASGKIRTSDLREALTRQEQTGEYLGRILSEMGILSQEQVAKALTAKAEETLYGLFDWHDASFRFTEGGRLTDAVIEVTLSVDEILLSGIQRLDEISMIRRLFGSSGVVLERAESAAPAQFFNSGTSRRLLESVDGQRSIAEILLHARTSEFLVLKLLYHLHHKGVVTIKRELPADPESTTLLDAVRPVASDSADPVDDDEPPASVEAETRVARMLLARGEYGPAVELLHASRRAHPDSPGLRKLIARAERVYQASAKHGSLAPNRVPVLRRSTDDLGDVSLSPDARFLLSLIDGEIDIKSILWLAPLREVDALRGLQQLLDAGVVELPAPEGEATANEVHAAVDGQIAD